MVTNYKGRVEVPEEIELDEEDNDSLTSFSLLSCSDIGPSWYSEYIWDDSRKSNLPPDRVKIQIYPFPEVPSKLVQVTTFPVFLRSYIQMILNANF